MLVRALKEHTVDKKAKVEGDVYDLTDGAVASAVERELVEVLPKAELKELAEAAVDAGVAGDPRDLQASAAAGLDADVSTSKKSKKASR